MKKILFVLVATYLTACAPLLTQSPGDGLSPINAVKAEGASHLMLFGYDVVNYFTDNTHKQGTSEFQSIYKNVNFYFSSIENKKLFDTNPDQYLPQYGGYCANGIAYAIPWGGNADTWKMINGKLYIFGGESSREAFLLDTEKNIELANQYWNSEINGSNAFIQRTKRLVFKVPHYKTGEELAAAVAASKVK